MEKIFKIGDEVERINESYFEINVGDIGKITSINGKSIRLDKFRNYDYSIDNFKLVNSKNLIESIQIW